MASQHIDIKSTASRFSAEFRQLIDRARNLQEDALKVSKVADQIASGGDWTALSTYLGVTEVQAQAVYNLLTAFKVVINKPDYDSFVDRLG